MARIVLVTGGCRSGKSAYAEHLPSAAPSRLYVATAPASDEEMQRRIDEHRRARQGRGWETIEEQLDLAGVFFGQRALQRAAGRLRHAVGQQPDVLRGPRRAPRDEARRGRALRRNAQGRRKLPWHGNLRQQRGRPGRGAGNAEARRYRDLVGRANQLIAARADAVTLVCCGIPLPLKEKPSP